MRLFILVFLYFFLCVPVQAKVKSEDISFAKHFYTDNIKTCPFVGSETFNSDYTKSRIESLINLDWMSEWAKGNSRSVNHENLTGPISLFAVTTHTALGNNDKNEINLAKDVLIKMAKANILLDTIGKKELKKKTKVLERWKSRSSLLVSRL